ncbi:MAG: GAF domain-containing protein, partial [Anaerolineae bacterium]|nr:GAF domain-containing protein [Anaerolineae bacterium]
MKAKKILVVDDSPTQSMRSRIILETLGFEVMEANNGKKALDMALVENPDVIISDILMPEMDGFELCHLIQLDPQLQHIPVVLQTASYRAKEDREFGLDIGADAFVPKGAGVDEMSALINRVLAEREKREKSSQKSDKGSKSPFDALHAQRMLFRLLEETAKLEQANASIKIERNRAQKYLDVASVIMVAIDLKGKITMINPRGCQVLEGTPRELIGMDWIENFIPGEQQPEIKKIHEKILLNQRDKIEYIEYTVITRKGNRRFIAWHNTILTDDSGAVSGILSSGEDITERKQAEENLKKSEAKLAELYEAEKQRVEQLSALQRIGDLLAGLHSQNEVMEIVANHARKLVHCRVCVTLKILKEQKEVVVVAESGQMDSSFVGVRLPVNLPMLNKAIESGKPVIIDEINRETIKLLPFNVNPDIQFIHIYPIGLKDQTLGFMIMGGVSADNLSEGDITSLQLLAERAAAALKNAILFDEINNSLKRLAALRAIDQAITNSLDINFTMGMLLDQVIDQLKVDAADILLLDRDAANFKFASERGFKNPVPPQTKVSIGNSFAGNAALERHTIHISDLPENLTTFQKPPHFEREGFISVFCTPLIAKGQVKGVLEVFHRYGFTPDVDWLSFLETLAGQAAIAIDNAELFSHLQRSNVELSLAYDATIQGWSDALDLRDKETEGHTQRVTELTLKLAELMGIDERNLIHIRRGALLHDIGKMGIPDSILLKPGPLTPEEWTILRKHPKFASDLVS